MIDSAFLILLCAALGDVTEIGAHQSPGKPMLYFEEGRPGEEILATKDGEKIVLHVRVNCPREGVEKYAEETAELTPTEWKSLLEIAEKEKLLEWKPDFTGGQVFDWGATGFRIKSDKEYAQQWTKPVKNGKGPAVLAKRLAALAREKVKGLKLHYLNP